MAVKKHKKNRKKDLKEQVEVDVPDFPNGESSEIHAEVKAGMLVRAKVIAVKISAAIVRFPGGVKARCPREHWSEHQIVKRPKTFEVGAQLLFRVLDCRSKRITVTYKKTLVKSELGILSSLADATVGLVTHGWITRIVKDGCCVQFYNRVEGFVPRLELGLEPECNPSLIYHVGEVVKCRITSFGPASWWICLSFIVKPTRLSEEVEVNLGSLVSGVVDKVTPRSLLVYVNAKGYMKGVISVEHLADHREHAVLMRSALKPGYFFDKLLVLDILGEYLLLSAKYSLLNLAGELPSDLNQIRPNTVVHGYVCNLIETSCYVRFLGRLTGSSPRSMAMDDQGADLSKAFYIGQSVRSNILNVCSETGKLSLSLKQSCCSSTDASFIQEYFLMDEKIAILQASDSNGSELKWFEGFNIGSVIEGKIQQAKDLGVVVSFERYDDIYGFITHDQLAGTTVETGSIVRAVVLDVAKAEHLVYLSLKPEFINKSREESFSKKKHKREASKDLELHQTVNAVVEIVKENYLVLSVPEYNYAIGYASISDYNTQKFPQKQYLNGQSVISTIMALPSPSTAGRLLLLLKSISEVTETSSSKRAKKKSTYKC